MKSIIFASAMTIVSAVSFAMPSQAATVTTVTSVRHVDRYHPAYRHGHCFMETHKRHIHGKLVIEKTKVCH